MAMKSQVVVFWPVMSCRDVVGYQERIIESMNEGMNEY